MHLTKITVTNDEGLQTPALYGGTCVIDRVMSGEENNRATVITALGQVGQISREVAIRPLPKYESSPLDHKLGKWTRRCNGRKGKAKSLGKRVY